MMDEIWRVLRDDGTCWINLGDTYGGSGCGTTYDTNCVGKTGIQTNVNKWPSKGHFRGKLDKCLLLIPHRFAIGCIDRGWIMRNDIIWAKRNGMPESCRDRFSKKHEYFFFMVKQQKYYFDLDGVRDKHKESSIKRDEYGYNGKQMVGRYQIATEKRDGNFTETTGFLNINGKNPGDVSDFWDKKPYAIIDENHRSKTIEYRDLPEHNKLRIYLQESKNDIGMTIDEIETIFGGYKAHHWFEKNGSYPDADDYKKLKEVLSLDNRFDNEMLNVKIKSGLKQNNPNGKNPGDVSDFWDIPTKPSSKKHYATYNFDLIDKCIIAGCPEYVCKKCGKPREKIIETVNHKPSENYTGHATKDYELHRAQNPSDTKRRILESMAAERKVISLTDCECGAGFEGGTILDPFNGSGTTTLRAEQLGRKWIGIDGSEEYSKIAKARIENETEQIKLSFI